MADACAVKHIVPGSSVEERAGEGVVAVAAEVKRAAQSVVAAKPKHGLVGMRRRNHVVQMGPIDHRDELVQVGIVDVQGLGETHREIRVDQPRAARLIERWEEPRDRRVGGGRHRRHQEIPQISAGQ